MEALFPVSNTWGACSVGAATRPVASLLVLTEVGVHIGLHVIRATYMTAHALILVSPRVVVTANATFNAHSFLDIYRLTG